MNLSIEKMSSDVSSGATDSAVMRLDAYGDLISDWLWECDADGKLIKSNLRLESKLGINDPIVGVSIWEILSTKFFNDVNSDKFIAELQSSVFSVRSFSNLEFKLGDKDLRVLISLSGKPVTNQQGDCVGFIGVGRFIETKTVSEPENVNQLKTLMSAVENAPNGVLITDDEGIIKYANTGFAEMTGYSMEECVGKTPRILSSGHNSPEFYKEFWSIIKSGNNWSGTVQNRKKNGDIFWCRETISPVVRNDGIISNFIAIQQDVTTEIQAQEKLKASEARFKGFADAASDWYWEMDAELRFSYVSASAFEHAGVEPEEVIGRPRSEFVTVEEDRMRLADHISDLKKHKKFKDFTYSFERRDGKARRWKVSGNPYFSDEGKFLGYRGVGRDVTEEALMEEKLHQSQKMEVVGQLTGGVAHDFNNILAVILGNAELLREEIEAVGEFSHLMERIDSIIYATNRGTGITSQLMMYSRKQTLQPETVYLADEFKKFSSILQSSVGQTVMVEIECPSDLWPCEADKDHLINAILNLAINARDAMDGSGKLVLRARNTFVPEKNNLAELEAGDYICLEVVDTGCGMESTSLQKVFEPFYTTKEIGQGTGLGLSMVYGFAKKSGGTVSISSVLGQGTTVQLYLPRST